MSGHTPGPWLSIVEVSDGGGWRDKRQSIQVWDDDMQHLIASYTTEYSEYPSDEMNAANARLIAAAPDLLEALNDLLEAADSMRGTYGCIQGRHPEEDDTHIHDKWAEEFLEERAALARAAITKATK